MVNEGEGEGTPTARNEAGMRPLLTDLAGLAAATRTDNTAPTHPYPRPIRNDLLSFRLMSIATIARLTSHAWKSPS